MESKHTPGPWDITETDIIYHSEDKLIIGPGPGFYDIARVKGYVGCEHDGLANARLIAAAPELLEALKKAAFVLKESGFVCPLTEEAFDDAMTSAFNAIAKAEGRS